MVEGIQKEFFSGHPTPGPPNAITNLLNLLNGDLGPLGGLGDILNQLPGFVTQQISPLTATALPAADSRMVTLLTDPEGDVSTGKHAAPAGTPAPEHTGAVPQHAAGEVDAAEETDEETEPTTQPTEDTTKDTSTSSTSRPKPAGPSPKHTTTKNPVGAVVAGVTHEVAGALKDLAPKKTTPKTTTKTDTRTTKKADTDSHTESGASSNAKAGAA